MRIKNKFSGFTLVETITVMSIIAVLVVITVCSTVNSGSMDKEQVKSSSRIMYSDLAAAYQNILMSDTTGLNITKLNDVEDFDESSEKLKELFSRYLELSDVSCNVFPNIENTTGVYLENIEQCAYSEKRYNIGFILEDENCESTYFVKEYYQDDLNTRASRSSCGYIVFAPKKSKGIIGEDFFIMALGKRGVR